jgi:hypothetical protein
MSTLRSHVPCLLALSCAPALAAQASIETTFDPSQTGGACGLALDGVLWVYGCFAPTIEAYTLGGNQVGWLQVPGAPADDVDLHVVTEPMTLHNVSLPPGTLIYFDGEQGVCEVYAIDPILGTMLSSLVTGFGSSHVVGGTYDPSRGTLFLVQDDDPGGTLANLVAEVDPDTGAVLSTFSTTAAGFIVGNGDIDVASTGDLYVVSSDEDSIAIFTPAGELRGSVALPNSVTDLSGLALDDVDGGAWVSSTSGRVWRLRRVVSIGSVYCAPASVNSTGNPALCRAFGSEDRSQNEVVLVASQLPLQSTGYFLTSAMPGLVMNPGGSDGDLCLGGLIGRYSRPNQVFNTTTLGRAELELDLSAVPSPTGLVSVQAGETWHYQAWYRDRNPFPTSNFTDAVAVTYR